MACKALHVYYLTIYKESVPSPVFYVLPPEFFLRQIRYVIYQLSNIKSLLTVGKINPEVFTSLFATNLTPLY